MGFTFDRQLALDKMDERVISLLEAAANTVVGDAKSHAPVRKDRPRQGKRRATPETELRVRKSGVILGSKNNAVAIPQTKSARAELEKRFTVTSKRTGTVRALRPTQEIGSYRFHDNAIEANTRGTVNKAFTFSMRPVGETTSVARNEIKHGRGIGFANGRLVHGGFLKRNIRRTEVVAQGTKRVVTVRSHAPYSVFVEFGTSRSRAQPFLLPAFKRIRQRLIPGGK